MPIKSPCGNSNVSLIFDRLHNIQLKCLMNLNLTFRLKTDKSGLNYTKGHIANTSTTCSNWSQAVVTDIHIPNTSINVELTNLQSFVERLTQSVTTRGSCNYIRQLYTSAWRLNTGRQHSRNFKVVITERYSHGAKLEFIVHKTPVSKITPSLHPGHSSAFPDTTSYILPFNLLTAQVKCWTCWRVYIN